ncbi:MAG: hypothetical protein QOG82_906 [Actinomycetota bacterium]|nr:hypothetical protein [Actinomycetota bacterium]
MNIVRGLLTRRGWGVVIGAAVLVLAGRSLGLVELYVLAAGSLGLVVGGAVYVLTRHPDLEASRQLNPPRVHVGDNSRVELSIRNRSRRRSPVLALRDALAGGPRQARFLLPPLAPGQTDSASYRLPADRRGVFSIGPLEAERSDPFGLARRSSAIAPVAELTVYPRIDKVRPLPDSPGRDRHHTTPRAAAVGLTGEDFYALRAYQQGDDLRRVHWPSTARRDEIMIRQNEVPWQGRATIVLDIRARLHTDASLEAAVSAAASVITACWQHGSVVRLVTTDGVDSGFGSGPGHLEVILARLAVLVPVGDAGPGLDSLGPNRAVDGAVAVVTTSAADPPDLDRLARLGRSPSAVTLVAFAGRRARPEGAPWPGVGHVVAVAANQAFASVWDATLSVGGPGLRPAMRS